VYAARILPAVSDAPSLVVEQAPLDSIHEDPANVRKHGPRNLDSIVASLQRFGQQKPIVVDADGIVRAGNGTLAAARAMGWPTIAIVRTNLNGPEAVAYAIADNRTSELAEWDEPALLDQLTSLGEDLRTAAGFAADELRARLAEQKNVHRRQDLDELPPAAEPVASAGQLYVLGEHRLLVGDATNPADVERLLGGARPELLVTDPPYGVRYDPKWRHELGLATWGDVRTSEVKNDDVADWREAFALAPADVVYAWHSGLQAAEAKAGLSAAGFELRAQIVWVKQAPAISRGHYNWQHEPCWYAVRQGATARWIGDSKQHTVWEINRAMGYYNGGGPENEKTDHSTQKPVECMERPLRNHSGDVYDPFVGSGSTVIAAERQGRRCFAMDIDPHWIDVTVRRWEAFTGEQAELVDA
jgi:hypothetical protein